MSTDYDDMPAGREIDGLVAERVMGWRRGNPNRGDHAWFTLDNENTPVLPPFSTDITAAWKVVERLAETSGLGHSIHVQRQGPKFPCWVSLGMHKLPVPFYARAETAPLAICRAALKAVSPPPADEPH